MADVSKIKLPNGTTYNIKDENALPLTGGSVTGPVSFGDSVSIDEATVGDLVVNGSSSFIQGVKSNQIVPFMSKTYTDVIGTANSWSGATFFYGSIKPDSWNNVWRIKYRIKVYVPNHTDYCQMADVMISGKQGDLRSYYSMNTIGSYYVCYYHELYRMKEAGFNAGYGHSLGVRFYSAYAPTDTNYKRTIEIEVIETENCTFDFYDNCLAYASIPGTGSTNYDTYSEMDFVTNGLQETGDANDVNYYNREYYASRTTKNALYRYQLCVTDSTGQVIPINSVNNSVATNKTLMTDAFDPFGEIFYWATTSTYAAGANVGNGNLYRQYLADFRYSFNCGGYDVDGTLTARQPLYLVCTPQSDGTAKLYSSPLSQALPTSDNGLIYIYLGRVYEDTKPYRITLSFNHPVYWYKNGAVRQYINEAQTVNGHTVNADVPSGAKFTDTITTATTTGSGNAVTAVTASNGALTITKGITFLTSHQDISGKADKATTLAGYGITDAKIASGTITLGSNTITPLTSSSTLSAAKLSGAIPSAVTATTQASTDNSTKIATTAYVTTAIANLPEPMVFKGSVGTGGTVTSLPTAAASNEGWTYKVITALSSPSAKVGDTVISNGSSWVVIPSGDEPSGTVTSVAVSNGGGLSVSGSPITSSGTITISHADTSSQASSSNSGRTYIQSLTLDGYGHVTGISTATETVTNTDEKLKLEAVASGTYYPIVGKDAAASVRQYDTTGLSYQFSNGTTTSTGNAELILGNNTAQGTAGNKEGRIKMFSPSSGSVELYSSTTTYARKIKFPDKDGTVALTSDIPTIPTSTGSKVTGITASTTATKTTLGTAFTIPNVTSAGSASTWAFEEISIPNVTSAGSASTWAFEDIACDDITSWSAGSGSASISGAVDANDSTQLNITISHTHTAPTLQYTARIVSSKKSGANSTAPTLGTAIKVQSKKSGANGSAPTLGTAFTVPNVTGNTSATVSITDPGHTHSI